MSAVEVCNSFGGMNFRGLFPAIMFWSITFPLDFELESSTEHFTVQDLSDQIFFFSSYDFWWRRGCWMTAYYRVGWGSGQFYYIEDQVESSHGEGEA